jgi:hypothetical protein
MVVDEGRTLNKSKYMHASCATRRCTPGVPTVYPYPQYPWLTQPEGRRVRVLTGMGTGQPGITWGLPVLIPIDRSCRLSR